MPCKVSDEEIAYYERAYNLEHYGVDWTQRELTTSVACWLAKNCRRDVEIPPYVLGWIKNHAKEDAK